MVTVSSPRRRIRIGALRAGYVALGVSFLSLGAARYLGLLLPFGLLFAIAGGILFALSRDDLPRYAGLGLLAYFLVSILVFLAATPLTLRSGGSSYFVNDSPSPQLTTIYQDLLLGLPIVLGAALTAAAWEREWTPRVLVLGALGGSALWFVLILLLQPGGGGVNMTADQASLGASTAQTTGRIVDALLAVAGLSGAAGAFWASARPDEYA